jgi:hypothetical protein
MQVLYLCVVRRKPKVSQKRNDTSLRNDGASLITFRYNPDDHAVHSVHCDISKSMKNRLYLKTAYRLGPSYHTALSNIYLLRMTNMADVLHEERYNEKKNKSKNVGYHKFRNMKDKVL